LQNKGRVLITEKYSEQHVFGWAPLTEPGAQPLRFGIPQAKEILQKENFCLRDDSAGGGIEGRPD